MINEKLDAAQKILKEIFETIDEVFTCYFISLSAPKIWRPHVENYEKEYDRLLQEEDLTDDKIKKRIAEQAHPLVEGEFTILTTTKIIRKILSPGYFENLQAKNTIKIVYDSWENIYRPKLADLLGKTIQGDIWGDLRYIRESITHRDSRGVDKIKNAKLIKHFNPYQEIILTLKIMEEIRQELEKWYTEFLMTHFSPLSHTYKSETK